MTVKSKFAERLRELREERGLPQVQLAAELDMGSGFIANIELGTRMVSVGRLIEIADYFGVSTDYLLGRSDEKYL